VSRKLEAHAEQLRALGHPARLAILRHVAALRALTDYLWEDCCKGGERCC
jgi:DNA-binding transcriptional ArsR family regulator